MIESIILFDGYLIKCSISNTYMLIINNLLFDGYLIKRIKSNFDMNNE